MKNLAIFIMMSLALFNGVLLAQEGVECKNGICQLKKTTKAPVGAQEKKNEGAPQSTAVIEITAENFDTVVKKSTKPVVIDCYATWCGPCKTIKPVFAELAQEEKGWVFASLDIDKCPALAQNFGVQAMPSFVVFKNGVQMDMIKGGLPKEKLMQKLKQIAALEKPVERSRSV